MSQRKPRKNCLHCGLLVKGLKNKYCNNSCQNSQRYKTFIALWLRGEVTGVSIDGSVSEHIRRHLKDTCGEMCSRCGWKAVSETTGRTPLEVEHIDGNWQNNRPENLCLLCPNCHSLTPTYRALNRGNGRSYRKKYYTNVA